MGTKARFLKIIIPILIVAGGAAVMVALVKGRPAPEKMETAEPGLLVRTERVSATDWQVTVRGTATTQAVREVSVIPQVSGVVMETADGFTEGGFFEKGKVLFRIEDTDYRLALEGARAAKAQAEYEVETIKSNAEIARREWEIMTREEPSEAPSPLVLYEPQLKSAEASLDSARASVEQAELNLRRTVLRAPFDCRVRTKSVDRGQFVMAGTEAAVVASTDTAEAVVQVRQDEMLWITIPGSAARVTAEAGGQVSTWDGRVVRTLGEVDPKTRTVQVVVEVADPYGLGDSSRRELLDGSFVTVEMEGRTLSDVFVIPRAALREGSTVWVMDDEGLLRVRGVHVVRSDEEVAVVDRGLADGERVVLTRLGGAADGMRLRETGDTGQ